MSKKIQVIIDEDGTVEIEAIGYKGPSCEEATKALEDALGIVTNRAIKPEYKSARAGTRVNTTA